jgi:hypothetical protein
MPATVSPGFLLLSPTSLSRPLPERFTIPRMFDFLMLILLLAAFGGAALYVRVCLDVTRPAQPPRRDAA